MKTRLSAGHRLLVGINRQRAVPQIAETPAIVQAHDMVGVRVGENDGVEPADVFPQALDAGIPAWCPRPV